MTASPARPERWSSIRRRGRSHGIRATYVAGCHCEDCRRANADYLRGYRRRRRWAAMP